MKLRIGDKVRFLNEIGEGVITRFKDKDTVFVEMNDGFEIPYLSKHLVPIHTELILNPEVENMELELETILSDSIYFIIEPDHDMPALVTDFKFYLFNSSSYNVSFTYSVKDEEYFQTLKHGELGAYQKVLLKQVKKNFFKEFAYHKIECLFYKNMHYKSQIPLAEILYINEKIISQSSLIEHNEFKFKVYAYILKENFLDKEVVEQTLRTEDLTRLKSIKEFKQPQKKSIAKQRIKDLTKEIDLHIEELIDSHSGLTNAQILNIQRERFEREMEYCLSNGIKKLIVIHGVGNGKLKQEITAILKTIDGISYHDASYKNYGFGATEILIH
ncbi:MAG: Smr/MutS family protein [Bacteroidetes bacterium]|nr:Smr/MutS family protein [Bacteroidota bacterium]